MAAAGMGTMGKRCCCCPDFWVFSEAGGVLAWRALRTPGLFPDNEVTIEVDPHNQRFGQRISPDYRNKKFYLHTIKQSDTTKMELVEYDFHFENRRVILEYARYGSPASTGLAIDYENGRLFYIKWTLYEAGVSGDDFEQEIRRIDLDGTNDTLVTTETWVENSEGQVGGIFNMCFEPITNRLFYTYSYTAQALKGGPPPTLDTNFYAQLKRCNADDGSDKTTLVSLSDTVSVHGDYFIQGIGVFPNTEKLFWIERHGTPLGSDTEIKIADLDAASPTVIFSDSFVGAISYTRCFPCEKDQRIYYESQSFPGGGELRTLFSIEQDGGYPRTEFHNDQGDWNVGDDGGSMDTGQSMAAKLGCKREFTGEEFAGSGYS